jgi:hypothetical protein
MMFDSLVIANSIELLNGGAVSANPLCPGAMFRLQPGADPGAPQPTTDFVASLLLDGERPFGRRASNRVIKLPVWITAPNRQILAAAREFLQRTIDQDYYTVTWTRDPAAGNPGNAPLPLLLDCFRAEPTVPVFNTLLEKQLVGSQILITIPALPYGRSDTQVQVSFAAPVPVGPAVPPPPAPVVLDAYSAISSPQCSQSTQCVVGPTTCCWDPDSFGDPGGQATPLVYGSSFGAPLNLTGMTSLQLWFGLGSRYYANLEYHGKTSGTGMYFTLTDASGNTLSFSRSNLHLPVGTAAQSPVFTSITIPIPQGSATFNYAAVVSYSVTVTNRVDRISRLSWVTAYLDALTAYPGSQPLSPVAHGTLFTLYGVYGTARSPVSMSFQQTPTPGTPTTVTATGPGTYTVPLNTAWLKVEAWGGGGCGGARTSAGLGPGGGGAEYTREDIFPALPGAVIPYIVGQGDTSGATLGGGLASVFGPVPGGGTLTVTANGGRSVTSNGITAGLGGSGSGNSVDHPGGAGRANPAGTFGGGGGSSGGTTAAGNTPVGSGSVTFTTAGTFSGGSGWLCPAGVFSVMAECWAAGGGGGAGNSGSNGAGGGGGGYRSTSAIPVTPGNFYTYVVGAGGGGGVSQGAGLAGGLSSFTGDSGSQVVASPGGGGLGNSWTGSGSGGPGGTGGTGAVGRSGGGGGPAYPYTGGGGASGAPGTSGNQATGQNGAIAPTGGGNGGNGTGNSSGNGQAGQAPGGGGGGSHATANSGGAGAAGQVRITYPATTGAPTATGGIAVSGGGAGGNGGATGGSAGSAGAAPGGGGGGAFSAGTSLAGGAGANGQLKITPYASAAFKTLIVHRPPYGALKTFVPMVSVGAGADAPDGTHQYTMPQPVTGINADFGGTYTIYLINSSWNGSGARTVFVTVTQAEYAGGATYATSTLPVTVTPAQVTNGILTAGVLTLPSKAVAPDNMGGYYTVSVTDTNTSDRWLDCLFLDTMGQTQVINEPSSGYVTYYSDAPNPNVSVGRVMGSQGGRANAISVLDNAILSGTVLHVEPDDGDNQLFVYCADSAVPSVSLSYFPCYFFDRTQ